ncbi:hypothetical protein XENOCAPTIV_023067 [Xenoophorus captivus]|uniref:Uncharacterized protein n=1 Tax=Xenoophorus captivus TaxID=1517983 RepID=A0ABV0QU06_9TELE
MSPLALLRPSTSSVYIVLQTRAMPSLLEIGLLSAYPFNAPSCHTSNYGGNKSTGKSQTSLFPATLSSITWGIPRRFQSPPGEIWVCCGILSKWDMPGARQHDTSSLLLKTENHPDQQSIQNVLASFKYCSNDLKMLVQYHVWKTVGLLSVQ